jgi:hypothetical protein
VPYASIPRKDDSSDWFSVYRDLNLARTLKTNLLVVGTERLVLSLVSSLVADVHPDFMIQCHDGLLRLPPRSSQSGIVVLRDVDALEKVGQLRFLDWLDSMSKRLQVVSTAKAPLLGMVEASKFNPTLYYRLNTVYIDLTVEKLGRAIL